MRLACAFADTYVARRCNRFGLVWPRKNQVTANVSWINSISLKSESNTITALTSRCLVTCVHLYTHPCIAKFDTWAANSSHVVRMQSPCWHAPLDALQWVFRYLHHTLLRKQYWRLEHFFKKYPNGLVIIELILLGCVKTEQSHHSLY